MLMNLEIWPAILFTAHVVILATIVSLAVLMSCNVQYLNKRLHYLKTVDISQNKDQLLVVSQCILFSLQVPLKLYRDWVLDFDRLCKGAINIMHMRSPIIIHPLQSLFQPILSGIRFFYNCLLARECNPWLAAIYLTVRLIAVRNRLRKITIPRWGPRSHLICTPPRKPSSWFPLVPSD